MSDRTSKARKRARKEARDESLESILEGMYERRGKLVAMAKSDKEQRGGTPEWQKNVAIATNAGGAVAGPAALWMAVRQAKSKQGGMPRQAVEAVEAKSSPKTRVGRAARKTGKVLRNPKAIAAGGATAVGLQAMNWAGDAIAARALTEDKRRSKQATVAKNNDRKYTAAAITAGAGLGGAAGAFAGTNVDRLGRGSSKAKFSAFGPMMRDAERGRIPLEAVNRENAARIIRRNKALKGQKMKTKLARNRYALGGAALFGAIGAGSGLNHAHDVKTARDKGFNAMLQQQMERDIYKSDGQSLISKSDRVEVTGHGKSLVEKRNFNAEADRQRRLGLYAGAGLGAGVVLGDAARRRMPIKAVELKDGTKRKVIDLPRGRGGKARLALLAAGSAAGAGGGIAAYRRGISERNNAYL